MKNAAKSTPVRFIVPLIVSSYIFLALQPDLRLAIPALVGATAFCIIFLTFFFYAAEKEKLALSPCFILGFALFFRLLFLFRSPELSDDIYRYLWDGLQLLQGHNPYTAAPAAVKVLDPLSALLLAKINHPRLVTIYPPFAQLVFATGAAVCHSLTGIKILLTLLDLLACFLILKILSRLKLPTSRAILYAWHPLPIIEIAGSGHVDGVGIMLFLMTFYLLLATPEQDRAAERTPALPAHIIEQYGKPLLAGMIFATAVLVKLIPFFYLPALFLATAHPLTTGLGFLGGFLTVSLPFMPDLTKMLATLGTYLGHWEFTNFAFRSLRALLSSGHQARAILACLFMACLLFFTVSFRIRSSCQPGRQAPLLLMKSLYGITFAFLLLTPTLHPWYALYLVGFLPFVAGPAGIVLSWAVLLSYQVLIGYTLQGQWQENSLTAALIWLAPVLAWFIHKAIRYFLHKEGPIHT